MVTFSFSKEKVTDFRVVMEDKGFKDDGFKVTRRGMLGMMGVTLAAAGLGCSSPAGSGKKGARLLILGFDGMDYLVVSDMIEAGELPNFAKVARGGSFSPLVSSTPPQSPVAWSNFITGKNPGGHGIYDFIARDPKTYMPFLSMAKVTESDKDIKLMGMSIPLSAGKAELLRKGKSWWEILEDNGIPATVLCVPANFPPIETSQRTLSGMGTPDILGTYGTFSFYTTKYVDATSVQGGKITQVSVRDGSVSSELTGPVNTLMEDKPDIRVPFTAYLDQAAPQVKLAISGNEIILKEGEWSDWLSVSFPLTPLFDIKGIVRVYLKSIKPEFELYISPVNIDPAKPSLPISTPADYSRELDRILGPFYTQGMPEETWALNESRLNEDEFLVQAHMALSERTALFKLELERFRHMGQGAYFCYFGTTDTTSHMLWLHREPGHPLYDPSYSPKYARAVDGFYQDMDRIVGHALENLNGDDALMIMSDHGFAPFNRAVHVNRWLLDNGYIVLKDEGRDESDEFFENVDMGRTKAYAIGLNGLYINLAGREGNGIVPDGPERNRITREIIDGLASVKDPKNGEFVMSGVYDAREIYSGAHTDIAPDIVLGYGRGYRGSWETALGKIPKELVSDNSKKWSGDHCVDPAVVPGIFFCNRKINTPSPYILDIAPSILTLFGIAPPGDMDGRSFI